MPSKVAYHCPCSTGSSPLVGSAIASSSTHLLPSLYFCEECDSIRCNLCTNNEVSIYYCPSCLFEVPTAGIKGEKSRCARNCFLCPVCANTLAVSPSDLGSSKGNSTGDRLDRGGRIASGTEDEWDPKSAQASMGEAPYYLVCSACKWDSKEIGMTFEKSTGLSLHVQRQEETAADVLEFNQLRSHFETYLRTTNEHQQPASTLPSVARTSKLLRDVPSLANDPLFLQKRNRQPKAEAVEEMKPYTATSAWATGRDRQSAADAPQGLEDGKALGIVGKREQMRIDFVRDLEDEREVSGLIERWQAPADQSVRIGDIRPCRVPLKTKQTKRCPACRHIIVKSEPKAQSSRYKIKLMALNYLPEIQIKLPVFAGSAVISADERRRNSALLASRRRDAGVRIDEENLHAGRTYIFETTFINPLDDAMTVHLQIAPRSGSLRVGGADESGRTTTSPSKRESNRPDWYVSPTTTTFPISAFNEVWELDEEENDLLQSVSKGPTDRRAEEGLDLDDLDELDDELDEEVDARGQKRSRTDLSGKKERRRKDDGILKRKGHETTIGLELVLSKDAVGEIEFAMQVTFYYTPEASEEERQRWKKEQDRKSFSFWTIVRLGRVSQEVYRSSLSGMPATSTEARRSALDKRRSIMGINVGQSTASTTSTLAALQESTNEFKIPRDRGSLAGFEDS